MENVVIRLANRAALKPFEKLLIPQRQPEGLSGFMGAAGRRESALWGSLRGSPRHRSAREAGGAARDSRKDAVGARSARGE
ncbi:hypothetical protein EVAR_66435_1 [Eumeta japonica]|uniref:Uncharacterized protein n=1 Tax=Eumeta variegata TaxID=151549 RepID=A0A4C1ZE91_EUMVA|nr:hypothetical protein EVAR_66435_1 [Eumeta japonica]